ncbi:MAG: hypothetical protein M3Y56_10435 [Armatimonadota bacterium]|nr:hypothetical protein [Armatimonadota bacterium]
MGKNSYTSLLFAEPSFIEGVARILDFGNTLSEYNESPSSQEADSLALASDWQAINIDFEDAFPEFLAGIEE